MAMYGVFGSHTTEACPLNNKENRMAIIEGGPLFKQAAESSGVKVLAQYHSGLEHTFVWVLDAKDAQTIETLMIQTGVAKFNAVKIVPVFTFDDVIDKCKKMEGRS